MRGNKIYKISAEGKEKNSPLRKQKPPDVSRQTVSHFLSHLQAAGRSTIYSVATYSSLCERSNEVIS